MFSKGLSEGARKRVELAVAVAQEKLLATHVDHALDLISLVNEEVSFTDALEIYSRLLRLEEDDAQNISTRSLAILGALEPVLTPDQEARGNRAVVEFLDYLDTLVADRRRHPGDAASDVLTPGWDAASVRGSSRCRRSHPSSCPAPSPT